MKNSEFRLETKPHKNTEYRKQCERLCEGGKSSDRALTHRRSQRTERVRGGSNIFALQTAGFWLPSSSKFFFYLCRVVNNFCTFLCDSNTKTVDQIDLLHPFSWLCLDSPRPVVFFCSVQYCHDPLPHTSFPSSHCHYHCHYSLPIPSPPQLTLRCVSSSSSSSLSNQAIFF